MQWYYANDGQRLGPVTHTELERLVQAGTITSETLLWKQGMNEWQTLNDIRAKSPALIGGGPPPPPLPDRVVGAAEPAFEPAPAVRRTPSLHLDEAPEKPPVLVYAGFWRRTGAAFVDFSLWFFVWQILANIVGLKFFPEMLKITESIQAAGGGFNYQPKPEEAILVLKFTGLILLVGVVWSLVYDLLFLSKLSATPGKLLFGMRLVRGNGEALGASRIIARSLAKVMVVFTLGIGYLIVAFDDQKRGLHDYFCDTRVVKK
ncbi:MAG: RDD family protein [Rariglobus sp.]